MWNANEADVYYQQGRLISVGAAALSICFNLTIILLIILLNAGLFCEVGVFERVDHSISALLYQLFS